MTYTDTDTKFYEPISLSHSSDTQHDDADIGLADHNCFDQFTLDYVNDNTMDEDPNDMMMTDDSHHALGNIFAESSDNVIDFAADNDIIHNNEDLLLRDSAFSKFSVDSKLSTELANLFDDEEDEAPQDQDHVDANGDMQFSTFLDDTATRNMNLMMMGIGTKIVVPTKYDDVVLPEPEPIGVAQVVQHAAAAAVHQETKPQEQPRPKARVLNHGYNAIRSTKSRRRRASQPEPYRPQVDEVKASKQIFEYSSPYNHEEYQNQVKKSEEEDMARKRRSCNDLDLLTDVNSGAGGIGGQEVPLGEIEPPQKHQRGANGRRYQRRVTVDSIVSGPPSLSDLFGRRPSSTQYSSNQYHRSGSYVSQESSPSAATATATALHGILGTTTTRRTSFQEQDNMERRGSYHSHDGNLSLEDILGTASTATASASTTTAAAASTSNTTKNNPFQYHEALTKLAESMKRTELSRRQLKWYPSPQQVLGPSQPRRSSTSSDSLNALFGGVEEQTAAAAPTSSSSPFSNPIPTESVISWLECSSPNVNNTKNKSTNNMAAFFSGSRGTLTNGLEQSRKQMRMYADELKRTM